MIEDSKYKVINYASVAIKLNPSMLSEPFHLTFWTGPLSV